MNGQILRCSKQVWKPFPGFQTVKNPPIEEGKFCFEAGVGMPMFALAAPSLRHSMRYPVEESNYNADFIGLVQASDAV
jgi:hypothetical protein